MSDPLVCCVMLTRDRPEMAARAVRCFKRQTYENATMLIVDSSDDYYALAHDCDEPHDIAWTGSPVEMKRSSIGALRNHANSIADHFVGSRPEIICHWDDDDISQPDRIAQQVAMLQQTGAECVGYREMLFWREEDEAAWLYKQGRHDYAVGTSLCYWRRAWEGTKFRDTSRGEDLDFIRDVKTFGVSSMVLSLADPDGGHMMVSCNPMMVATIHAGNAEHYGGVGQAYAPEFRRVPHWDERVRRIMEAA